MDYVNHPLGRLSQLLDLTSLRQRVIANNVANVNTPGYHRLELCFDEALQRILDMGEQARPGSVEVKEITDGPARADGNNVDINQEMVNLDQNTLIYRTFAQTLSVRLAMLRTAITGQ